MQPYLEKIFMDIIKYCLLFKEATWKGSKISTCMSLKTFEVLLDSNHFFIGMFSLYIANTKIKIYKI